MKKLIFGVFLAVCWCTGTVKAQDIAVKTNLLYWSSTTPNLSLEFGLGKRTTLDLTGAYNPWTLNKVTSTRNTISTSVPLAASSRATRTSIISARPRRASP